MLKPQQIPRSRSGEAVPFAAVPDYHRVLELRPKEDAETHVRRIGHGTKDKQ
jgi:hypothetical protein